MKRTSSCTTSSSATSSTPRARQKSTRPLTSSSRAGAPDAPRGKEDGGPGAGPRRGGRAGRAAPRAFAREPLLAHLRLVVDQVGVGAEVARRLPGAVRVRRVLRADDEHEVALARELA